MGCSVSYYWVIGASYFKTAWWSHLGGSKSLKIFLGFSTLQDEATALSQKVRHQYTNDTTPYPRRKETL